MFLIVATKMKKAKRSPDCVIVTGSWNGLGNAGEIHQNQVLGDVLSYTREWGRRDGTPLLPFAFPVLPFQDLNELTSLIAHLSLNSFIHGMTLALSNIPAAPD